MGKNDIKLVERLEARWLSKKKHITDIDMSVLLELARKGAEADAPRTEVERLRAELHTASDMNAVYEARLQENEAEVERLRAAATALIDFHNGLLEAKRPDVFQLLMNRLSAALEERHE